MTYVEMAFQDLRDELKERGLKAGGSRDALIDRLTDDDLGHEVEKPEKKEPIKNPSSLRSTDPNPHNPNYDMAGRWIRRTGKEVGPTGLPPKPGNRW